MQVHSFETEEYSMKSNIFIFIAVYQEYIKEKEFQIKLDLENKEKAAAEEKKKKEEEEAAKKKAEEEEKNKAEEEKK